MTTNFTQRKAALDEIANSITSAMAQMANAQAALSAVQSTLGGLAAKYSGVISDIDADATANPSDSALQAMKAEKDKMVADFQAQKARADSFVSAVSGL